MGKCKPCSRTSGPRVLVLAPCGRNQSTQGLCCSLEDIYEHLPSVPTGFINYRTSDKHSATVTAGVGLCSSFLSAAMTKNPYQKQFRGGKHLVYTLRTQTTTKGSQGETQASDHITSAVKSKERYAEPCLCATGLFHLYTTRTPSPGNSVTYSGLG